MTATKTEAKPEDKAVAVVDPDRLARLREMTGEGNKAFASMNVAQLKIDTIDEDEKGVVNPNFGGFKIVRREKGDSGWEQTEEIIGKKPKMVILKKRFFASNWNEALGLPEFYTEDFDEWNNIIVMHNDNSSGKVEKKVADTGVYKDLKEKYGLSPHLVLYVLYKGEILRYKGSSTALGQYWDYEKQFQDSSVAMVETQFSTEKARKDVKAPWYRLLQLKQDGISDDSVVFPMLEELNKNLKDFEAYQGTLNKGVTDTDIDEIFVDPKPTVETKAIPETTAEDTRVVPETAKAVGSKAFDL